MWYVIGIVAVSLLLTFVLPKVFWQPSNSRDWSPDQARLPYAEIAGNLVIIHNIRNFAYKAVNNYRLGYYNKKFDLNKLTNVYYIVEPFSAFGGSAHTFVSFEFEGCQYVAVSIEIRKKKGQSFSAIKGLFNQFEIMYVVADERDVIKLRSNFRGDTVYVYPTRASIQKKRALFLDMMRRVNELKDKPEFYNTISNTCTTNIVSHINRISPRRVPWSFEVILPGYSDRLAYKLGLIDTELSFKEAREKYRVNERALKYANSEDFSIKIRQTE